MGPREKFQWRPTRFDLFKPHINFHLLCWQLNKHQISPTLVRSQMHFYRCPLAKSTEWLAKDAAGQVQTHIRICSGTFVGNYKLFKKRRSYSQTPFFLCSYCIQTSNINIFEREEDRESTIRS